MDDPLLILSCRDS